MYQKAGGQVGLHVKGYLRKVSWLLSLYWDLGSNLTRPKWLEV